MRHAIVVNSKGGNTRMVADSLADMLAKVDEAERVYRGDVPKDAEAESVLAEADTLLVGFWCDKGDAVPEVATFLERLSGKRVFLFGTAGFGGSQAYFDRILDRVRGHLPEDVTYLGGAMCQGKMGPGVRKRYEAMLEADPDNAQAKSMIENFDAALAHPNEDDLARIAQAAREALGL